MTRLLVLHRATAAGVITVSMFGVTAAVYLSQDDIGRPLRVPRTTVNLWRFRFKDDFTSPAVRVGTGEPGIPGWTLEQVDDIKVFVVSHRLKAPGISEDERYRISRRLEKGGIAPYRVTLRVYLSQSDVTRELGAGRTMANVWRSRFPDFPEPAVRVGIGSRSVPGYAREQMEAVKVWVVAHGLTAPGISAEDRDRIARQLRAG